MSIRVIAPAAAALLMSACITARVDMKYAPTDSPEPLRVARMPKVLFAGVEDRSGGFVYSGKGAMSSGELAKPVAETVRDALTLELKRAGVPLVDSRADADAVLKAFVTAANESVEMGGFSAAIVANLGVGLQLRSRAGDLLWSNEVSARGSRTTGTPGIPGNVPSEAMNAALSQAMSKVRGVIEEDGALDRVFRGSVVASAPAPSSSPAPGPEGSDIDRLPPPAAARPHSYAVVIGIEHYREGLPNADFSADDAKLAASYLERALGVPERNVAVLTNERATKSDFEKYFERWLPNRVEAGDTVYVYYSGHGAPDPAKGDAYLVPYDGDPTYIDETGFATQRLFADLAKLPAKQIYVAMDSCFSGAGGRSVIAKGARPLVSVASGSVPPKVTVLAASSRDQISNTYQEKGHGLFTYFLLKGLKEKDGDLRAAFEYSKPEVARVARRDYNADQEPQWMEGR